MNVNRMYFGCTTFAMFHVTYKNQLHRFIAIHKSSPVASWDSKVSIVCTLQKVDFVTYCFSPTMGKCVISACIRKLKNAAFWRMHSKVEYPNPMLASLPVSEIHLSDRFLNTVKNIVGLT